MTLLDRLRRNKPQTQTKEEPSMPNQPTPAQILDAAQAEAENSALRAADVKARLLDGDPEVTPQDLDAAETSARHAALALEAARTGYQRAHEQALRDAWPAIRDGNMANVLDDPEGQLQTALDELTPKVRAALDELGKALAEAKAPIIAHNDAITALGMYVGQGGYVDPDDHAATFGTSHVTVAGRGGQHIHAEPIVDLWLASVLPPQQAVRDWLDRVHAARLLRGIPNNVA